MSYRKTSAFTEILSILMYTMEHFAFIIVHLLS